MYYQNSKFRTQSYAYEDRDEDDNDHEEYFNSFYLFLFFHQSNEEQQLQENQLQVYTTTTGIHGDQDRFASQYLYKSHTYVQEFQHGNKAASGR